MSVVLYLLPLGLIFDLAGYMAPSLRLFLIYGLLALPLCLRPSRQAGWLGVGLVLAMVARAVLPLPPVAETALLLLVHQGIWTVSAPVPRALRCGVVVYAFLHLFLFVSPLGHPVVERLAAAGNQVGGWLTGDRFHLAATYQNLGGMLLFLTLSVFCWDGSRVALARTAGFVLAACLLHALAAAILIGKADFAAEFVWNLKFREPFGWPELGKRLSGLLVVVFPGFLFLADLAVFQLLHFGRARQQKEGEPRLPRGVALGEEWKPRKRELALAVVAVGLVWVVAPPTAWRRPGVVELVFLEKGVVSFTKPDYERFGKAAGGMFGMLPEYARLFGCGSTIVKEVPAQLDPRQVLVVTNLDEDIGPEARARVWDFVAKGGKLWVMGDHTFIKNGRNHLNELLEPVHISLVNDSAQFFPQGWFHSYVFPQGTPFGALRDDAENRPGILVGASLDVRVPAEPLITGRYGYSDAGLEVPEGDRGYLGDFKYQRSERLGDLVLVAGERHGKGRVLVFGDTSSFFNHNLSRSFELLRACLSWLGGADAWEFPASAAGRGVAAVMLSGMVALGFLWRAAAAGAWALAAAGLLSLAGHGPGGWLPWDEAYARAHLSVIDFSHQPNASKHSSMDNGLHGVSINLLRHGLLPVAANGWDRRVLKVARQVVLVAPREPLAAGECADLTAMMERGGTVILACGHMDAAACRKLLEPLGVRIGGSPLGRFFDRQAFGKPVSFMSAWPLEVKNAKANILCSYNEQWPLIVSLPVGEGELVVIGDSEFLHNRNLEGNENHDPANTTFLKNLLDSTSQ